MNMPLAHLTVLDLSRYLPGPAAAALLGDFGANVIRVEPPASAARRERAQGIGGEGEALARQRAADASGRGKARVALDFFTAPGREALLRMVASADVLIHDFRPATLDEAGLGWPALRAANPGLVCLAVSATGQDGPRAGAPGHDPIALALAGALARTGETPHMLGFPPADLLTAAHGAFAAMVALQARAQSGEGALIDAAMSDSALALMSSVFTRLQRSGSEPPLGFPLGDSDVFETADGGHVAATNMEPAFWARFCRAVDRPDLIDSFAAAERPALERELAAIYRSRTRAEWDALAREHDLQISPVLSPAEALEEPHHHERGALVRAGDTVQPGRFIRIDGLPPPAPRPARAPGADTAEVLRGFGFTAHEIADLAAQPTEAAR